ncbi:MAG: nitroreductase family protein [Candidatus Heteroscillospira sp.]|jgi:hypothetical protein
MELLEAMSRRHSVRSYIDAPLRPSQKAELRACIEQCNRDGGLHIQLVTDEPEAFSSLTARCAKFSGVSNYLALIGPDREGLEEKCGYHGEKLVLRAQQLGLNTCWAGATYAKNREAIRLASGERLCLVVAVGHGRNQGEPHRSRKREEVMRTTGEVPAWFIRGVDAALLAPTAMNQQKFMFILEGNGVRADPGRGFFTRVDLGIAKYHFELGAGVNHFRWL